MEVGYFCGVGDDGIDYDYWLVGIFGDFVEYDLGLWEVLWYLWVFFDEYWYFGVFEFVVCVIVV